MMVEYGCNVSNASQIGGAAAAVRLSNSWVEYKSQILAGELTQERSNFDKVGASRVM